MVVTNINSEGNFWFKLRDLKQKGWCTFLLLLMLSQFARAASSHPSSLWDCSRNSLKRGISFARVSRSSLEAYIVRPCVTQWGTATPLDEIISSAGIPAVVRTTAIECRLPYLDAIERTKANQICELLESGALNVKCVHGKPQTGQIRRHGSLIGFLLPYSLIRFLGSLPRH